LVRVSKITKRDGMIVGFDETNIAGAILKALKAVERGDGTLARELSEDVVRLLNERFKDKIPSVENVQDLVEEVLIRNGYADVAKAYILYRQKRTEIREYKKFFGVVDDLKMGVNAIKVLKNRYLMKDYEGKVTETPSQMFRRVARAVAKAGLLYDKKSDVERTEEMFYQVMADREFLPNSPTLMNAGTRLGQLSACFVLPVEDSIDGIFTTLKHMAMIHKSGGGTGFSFSKLRPAGDIVGSTKGVASGPVSFMTIYDAATNVIKQGGRRRGANMAILDVTHPDILRFIEAKSREGILTNFNISVAVTDQFMDAVEKDGEVALINPRNGKAEAKLRARHIFDLIVSNAWRTGDPGLIFIDEINRHNPTPHVGEIRSTNPCGEQPLLPFESCNLGSINLAKMVKNRDVDWENLRKVTRTAPQLQGQHLGKERLQDNPQLYGHHSCAHGNHKHNCRLLRGNRTDLRSGFCSKRHGGHKAAGDTVHIRAGSKRERFSQQGPDAGGRENRFHTEHGRGSGGCAENFRNIIGHRPGVACENAGGFPEVR